MDAVHASAPRLRRIPGRRQASRGWMQHVSPRPATDPPLLCAISSGWRLRKGHRCVSVFLRSGKQARQPVSPRRHCRSAISGGRVASDAARCLCICRRDRRKPCLQLPATVAATEPACRDHGAMLQLHRVAKTPASGPHQSSWPTISSRNQPCSSDGKAAPSRQPLRNTPDSACTVR